MNKKGLVTVLIITALVIVFVSISFLGILDTIRYGSLVSGMKPGEAVKVIRSADAPNPELENESTDNLVPVVPLFFTEETGILAVSTGEISHAKLKNASDGSYLADSTLLKVVTKDSKGRVRTFNVAVQLSSNSKDLAPWFVKQAALISSESLPVMNGDLVEDSQLKTLFPRGSKWVFKPLVNVDELITQETQDYSLLATRYYGGDFSGVEKYLNDGLAMSYNKPILLSGINGLDTVENIEL